VETMQETVRRLREEAWDEGYAARDQRNPRLRATWKKNPYRKVDADAVATGNRKSCQRTGLG
jgi:hypothetical protein